MQARFARLFMTIAEHTQVNAQRYIKEFKEKPGAKTLATTATIGATVFTAIGAGCDVDIELKDRKLSHEQRSLRTNVPLSLKVASGAITGAAVGAIAGTVIGFPLAVIARFPRTCVTIAAAGALGTAAAVISNTPKKKS